jgi:hypothetical protein
VAYLRYLDRQAMWGGHVGLRTSNNVSFIWFSHVAVIREIHIGSQCSHEVAATLAVYVAPK